jgi:large subunit ribosomal protein L15
MIIDDVNRGIKKNRKRKRLGRGIGSGQGKTAGRGHKGQGSRAGASSIPVFQGGAMPLVRRVPKRGFHNRFGQTVVVVNLGEIDKAYEAGDEVTLESLAAKNLAKGRFDLLKVLGDGELTKKLKIHAHRFSKSAHEKIAQAGGEAITEAGKVPAAEKIKQTRAARGTRGAAAGKRNP